MRLIRVCSVAFSKEPIKKEFTWGVPGRVKDADYFYFGTAPDEDASLAIVCGGYEACAPDFDIHRTAYPYWFVKYTIAGKGTLETEKRSYELKPGTLSGFEPGTSHHYRSNGKDPLVHIFVTLVGEACRDLFTKSSLRTHCVLRVEEPQETQAMFERLLRVGLQKPPHAHEICCHCLHVAVLFQTSIASQTHQHSPQTLRTYEKCKQCIDTRFSSLESVCDVASVCGVSVRYMSSLFKQYGAVTPSHYLMRLKLNKAANLLHTTDMSIKDIAQSVGFDDPYHFSRNFKQCHGQSPRQYRGV
ncbi:MAG: helix-turn-helix transcriptional regulator [Phycisphaeraceae bacterium]|nr:helix-turn-helix transcriptional regulator [Phycisphaeraceae bacterium]